MGCESCTRTVPEISAHEVKRTRITRIVSRILLAIAGDVNYHGLTDTDKATGPTYRARVWDKEHQGADGL